MPVAPRINEIVALLERFVLSEASMSKRQVKAALRLLDLMIDDAPPPDDGAEALMSAFAFPRKFSA
jgi:hypothetical protein